MLGVARTARPPVAPATAPPTSPSPMPLASEPAVATPRRGPSFENRQFIAVPPGSGETAAGERPRWPSQPPLGDHQTSNPPATPPAKLSRVGLVALSLIALAAIAAGSFFIGRSLGGGEIADTLPVNVPAATAEPAPTATPAPTPVPATVAPAQPTQPPQDASRFDAPPIAGDAVEPVAAAASAVAPAVVLIQHELGQGSGIIYDEAGYILTNAHVVGQFSAVSVQLASGIKVPGTVLGADENTDVAVVKIDSDAEFGVAQLAAESTVQVGQLAVAIGSPFGLEQTVTSGVVSAKGRVVGNVAMIQTDAPINPGNSGGALADRQGRVIGMNTSIRTDGSGGNVGVGFAIPADTAQVIASRIIAGESLDQGFLGITGETPQLGTPGAKVVTVNEGSGAANAGILPDDLITSFNGQPVRSMSDLAAEVRLQQPEATVIVELLRGDERVELSVTLGMLSS